MHELASTGQHVAILFLTKSKMPLSLYITYDYMILRPPKSDITYGRLLILNSITYNDLADCVAIEGKILPLPGKLLYPISGDESARNATKYVTCLKENTYGMPAR
jgi:hypothetical protein